MIIKNEWRRCLNNKGHLASLRIGYIYRVLDDEEAKHLGMIRVIDESRSDYLYPEELFSRPEK